MNPYEPNATQINRSATPSQGWRLAGRCAALAVTAFYLWNAIGVCFYPDALRQSLLPVLLMGISGVLGLSVVAMPCHLPRQLWFAYAWACFSILLALLLAAAPIALHEWLLLSWHVSLIFGSVFAIYAFRKFFHAQLLPVRGIQNGGEPE